MERTRTYASSDLALEFGQLLREYRRRQGRDVLVSWIGGEPFLWPPLMDVSHHFKHQFKLHVSVSTNGIMPTSQGHRERVIEDFDEMTFSIDGRAEFHDAVRNGSGIYEKVRSTIIRLSELKSKRGIGPLIRVNTILMHDNVHHFERLCRTVAKWGVEELTFNTLGGQDRPEFFPANTLTYEDAVSFQQELPRISKQMASLGLRIHGSRKYLDKITASAMGMKTPIHNCAPCRNFLFIDVNGFLGPCSGLANSGSGISVREIKFPEDLQALSPKFNYDRSKKMPVACGDCPSTEFFGKFADPIENPEAMLQCVSIQ